MRRLVSLVVFATFPLSATIAWAQALPSVRPQEVGLAPERLARIGPILRSEIEQGKLPGAVLVVARKGRVAYAESFGFRDKAAGAPMTRDTIFRIYSMTKPIVSVAAVMLMEEGRLVLTDPVSKFLPPLAKLQVSVPKVDPVFGRVTYTLVPAEREMTIQDLLRHTSGLAYGEITVNQPVKEGYAKAGAYLPTGLPFDARGVTPAEQVEGLGKAPLAHQPGAVWEYSLSTDVLGRVIEAVSRMPLGEFLEDRLFAPLKMRDSGFVVPRERLGRLAQPLPTDPATGSPIKLLDVSVAPKNASGGAGAVSTADDYLRFGQMLLNGGNLDGVRLLSRSTVSLMTSDHLARVNAPTSPGELLLGTPGYTFGLGFAVRQGPGVAGTPGSAGEFMWAGFAGTYFWIDPKEELVGVLMSQAPGPMRVQYRKLVKQLVYQAIVD
ncbi:MAG TPA: serine hydrolase domain-containing protein [Methylomirabilota bacterium]|jgi:CubicO group peptidase (beta-lactamase class C family)|nr:serine hydrolase domain-containing protein [Methylomirabilota bacterium]HEV8639663.1 serine hydrolase domain-containing protein [Methylomirabilota bacterium]